MPDTRNPFQRLALTGESGRLQQNTERAFDELQRGLNAAGNYTPSNAADWNDPPPTTFAEALDRLAAVAASTP